LVLGNGIRQNISKLDVTERSLLRDAFIALHELNYDGDRDQNPAGGVSFWYKQDEIHQGTHVHGGAAFLPWHREICNRFEGLLRGVNSDLSLHYWDWKEDPIDLFTVDFMGSAKGDAGEPWLSAGFYNPNPIGEKFRGKSINDNVHVNPFDPPIELKRDKWEGTLENFAKENEYEFYSDEDIISSPTFQDMRSKLEATHNTAHSYIGGTIGYQHTAFRDPFVFLLHSNVDRLFTEWQYQNIKDRSDPEKIYGSESTTEAEIDKDNPDEVHVGILSEMAPWNGSFDPNSEVQKKLKKVRPWTSPEKWNEKYKETFVRNSKHLSIVIPRRYDTTLKYEIKQV
jgi:hypothetical protein